MLGSSMKSKRPHSKSRSGCYRCKSKRIKCDETKPQCAHCARYSTPCVYPTTTNNMERSRQSSRQPTLSPGTSRAHSTSQSSTTSFPAELYPSTSSLGMTDLALLQHWISAASLGFGLSAQDDEAWRSPTVELALKYPFLMRGILAVSALHLARLHPESSHNYLVTAAAHQDAALPAHRYIINDVERNMDNDNCHAVVAYASLTTAYSLACPRRLEDGNGLYSLDEVSEWIYLLKGARSMLRVVGDKIVNGPMASQLRAVSEVEVGWHPDDGRLVQLERLYNRRNSLVIPMTDYADEDEIYLRTLRLLRESFALPFSPWEDVGVKLAIFWWVESIPQRFLDLLGECRPKALVLLAHMVVLLKRGQQCWYMRGAAERTLGTIKDLLDIDWLGWIQWPLEEVFDNSSTINA